MCTVVCGVGRGSSPELPSPLPILWGYLPVSPAIVYTLTLWDCPRFYDILMVTCPFINSSAWRPYNTIAKLKSTSNKHKDSQLTNKGPGCLGVSTVNLNVIFKNYAKELPINLMMKQCLIFKESCLSINNLIITLIFLRLILETNYRSNHVNELKSKSIHRPV